MCYLTCFLISTIFIFSIKWKKYMVSDSFINIFFASVARFLVFEIYIWRNEWISNISQYQDQPNLHPGMHYHKSTKYVSHTLSISLFLSFSYSQSFHKQQLPTLGNEEKWMWLFMKKYFHAFLKNFDMQNNRQPCIGNNYAR